MQIHMRFTYSLKEDKEDESEEQEPHGGDDENPKDTRRERQVRRDEERQSIQIKALQSHKKRKVLGPDSEDQLRILREAVLVRSGLSMGQSLASVSRPHLEVTVALVCAAHTTAKLEREPNQPGEHEL